MAVAELASSPTKEPKHFRTDDLRSRDLAFPDGNASSRCIARATRSTGMVQPICASDEQEARICTVERHGLLLVRLWWSDPARDSRAGRTRIRPGRGPLRFGGSAVRKRPVLAPSEFFGRPCVRPYASAAIKSGGLADRQRAESAAVFPAQTPDATRLPCAAFFGDGRTAQLKLPLEASLRPSCGALQVFPVTARYFRRAYQSLCCLGHHQATWLAQSPFERPNR